MVMRSLAAAAAMSFAAAGAASAQDGRFGLEEARIGLAAHDLTDHAEDGPQLVADLVFTSPDFLSPVWSPRPFLSASISTQGYTNLLTAGLAWDAQLTQRLRIEGSFGLSFNDGIDDLDLTTMTPVEAVRIKETRALLGNDVLFRSGAALDYALTDQWMVGVFYEHHSHGQILASGRNQGLDELGLRLSYRWR